MIDCETFVKMRRTVVTWVLWNVERHI